jgi:mannose/cellobiose epimerase-like protein (N-acyl-D-glucosamine 2-epimerase family)
MSSPEGTSARGTNADALREACAVLGAAQTAEALDDCAVQALLGAAVRLYAQRAADRDEPLAAFDATKANVTATDAMIATTAILKAVNIATFELGMWQSWARG